MIERCNILELIGKHRGKYRSCILTCYSFDFSFFEERVLPVLKTANIKNISVFADGKFLEIAQENTTGREFKHNKTYSFHSIYTSGVFHPKIMLLTGIKHGLLLIGSGNITSAGLNTNDEIWGAFHLDNIENENAGLFSDVWEYLQQFLSQVSGFATQKIEWIRQYSPWLQQLPKNNKSIPFKSLNQSISFICNSEKKSIYEQLLTLVPKPKLDVLTIVSPYYDLKGELLTEIYQHYMPKHLNCVIDAEFGLLPDEIGSVIRKAISFYNWKDCKKDYNGIFNRLHAKIFHFQYQDGTEYMMLGSANATVAAMGVSLRRPSNVEAGIVICRQSKKSLLTELGIELQKSKAADINSAQQNKFNLLPKEQNLKFKTRIRYSELKSNELTIYFVSKASIEATVSLFSNISVEIESVDFVCSSDKISILCKSPDDIFKVCITDNVGNIVSNFSIIHRLEYLMKCNPDPQQEKLNDLLEQEFVNGEGYTELLQFVDYNWADEDDENKKNRTHSLNITSPAQENIDGKKYETLPAKEFNRISNEAMLRQTGELTSANIKIADFLQIVSSDVFGKSEDTFNENEEQKLLEDTEQRGEGSEVPSSEKLKNSGQKEKRAISRYLTNLNHQYDKKLDRFFYSKAITEVPKEEISIKNLSNLLIALQLIQLYWSKKFTVEIATLGKEEKEIKEESYLHEGNLYSDCSTIKGFIIDALGKFLLLASANFKKYEYEILTQKLQHSRRLTFTKSIFILLNLSWNEKEIDYRNTLLLNTLYFLNPDNVCGKDSVIDISSQIEKVRSTAKHVTNSFDSNFCYFIDKLLPQYFRWLQIFESQESRNRLFVEAVQIRSGNYIFNSKIGFNVVIKNSQHKGQMYLSFKRAGYDWIEEMDACVLENIEYPKTKKFVVFN